MRKYSFQVRRRKGFTLVEFLMVAGIIGMLSAITITAINPARQIRTARDAERTSAANQLEKAINQYLIANNALPNANNFSTSLPAKAICKQGVITDTSCVNLDVLAPDYLAAIPQDAQEPNTNYSGYITYVKNGKPVVTAQNLEGSAITAGLIGFWKFDDGTGTAAQDNSGVGYQGLLTNGPLWTTGKTGAGLSFDGSNDYVSVADSEVLAFGTSNLTIGFWVRWNDLSTIESLIGQSNGGGANTPKWRIIKNVNSSYAYDDSKLMFGVGTTGGSTAALWDWTASTGVWYHVAIRRTGNSWSLFVNGTEIGTAQTLTTSIPNVASYLAFGSDGEAWNYVNGSLDDIRIYSRALSSAEIASIAAGDG